MLKIKQNSYQLSHDKQLDQWKQLIALKVLLFERQLEEILNRVAWFDPVQEIISIKKKKKITIITNLLVCI